MPGRRLFNINFNIGGNARTSVVTARAVNSPQVRARIVSAEGTRQPLTRGPEDSDTSEPLQVCTHRTLGCAYLERRRHGRGCRAQRTRPGCCCWAVARGRRVGGFLQLHLQRVRSLQADVLQRMKMFDGMLNLLFFFFYR